MPSLAYVRGEPMEIGNDVQLLLRLALLLGTAFWLLTWDEKIDLGNVP